VLCLTKNQIFVGKFLLLKISYHKTRCLSYQINEVGTVADSEVRYIIACFILIENELKLTKFKLLFKKVCELIEC